MKKCIYCEGPVDSEWYAQCKECVCIKCCIDNIGYLNQRHKHNKIGQDPKKRKITRKEYELWAILGINTEEGKDEFMRDEEDMGELVEYNKIYLIERLAGLEDFGEEDE